MSFYVVTHKSIDDIVKRSYGVIENIVRSTYLSHENGETINPDSYFLNFPKKPSNRIIALPASIESKEVSVSGIKWIASYPNNIKLNKQRASAVLLLNDIQTGYPIACLESSLISASRTAASTTLGAYHLFGESRSVKNIGFIGAGFIAKNILNFLINTGWEFDSLNCYDLNLDYCRNISGYIMEKYDMTCVIHRDIENIFQCCDLIFFATTSTKPYVIDKSLFFRNPVVINVSLRDMSEDIINESFNIVDDIEHSLKAKTSLHLTELKYKNRDFIAGTIANLINHSIKLPDKNITRIFSPFGMGILDLSVGSYILSEAIKNKSAIEIPDFISAMDRF